MKLTKEEQRDLLVLEMKRCIELLESSDLSVNIPVKGFRDEFYNIRNKTMTEMDRKLREVRRDSVRLMKAIYKEGRGF